LRPEVVEDHLEQAARVEHVLVRQRARPVAAPRRERIENRLVLGHVLAVEIVDLGAARAPAAEEGAPGALGDPLDQREIRRVVDHVVEAVVRAHPVGGEPRALAFAPAPVEQLLGQVRELLLGRTEVLQALRRHPRGREPSDERLQLGTDHERLPELVARDRPDAHAAVRDERNEPGRGEPAQRLADRRPADVEARRELLLAENRSRRQLTGDDRVLERQRDLVGLGAAFGLGRQV
jgi:hypothetical protein